jgi:hypothetical protein
LEALKYRLQATFYQGIASTRLMMVRSS